MRSRYCLGVPPLTLQSHDLLNTLHGNEYTHNNRKIVWVSVFCAVHVISNAQCVVNLKEAISSSQNLFFLFEYKDGEIANLSKHYHYSLCLLGCLMLCPHRWLQTYTV
jgi:hypothetical protein